jgi:hypothetical protein
MVRIQTHLWDSHLDDNRPILARLLGRRTVDRTEIDDDQRLRVRQGLAGSAGAHRDDVAGQHARASRLASELFHFRVCSPQPDLGLK